MKLKEIICAFGVLLTLSTALQAQEQAVSTGCLSSSDNQLVRLSGRIVYRRLEHPLGHYTVESYGLALLKPICFMAVTPQDGKKIQMQIDEIGLLSIFSSHSEDAWDKFWEKGKNRHRWDEMDRFIEDNIGKLMTVVGTIESQSSPDQIFEIQIAVGWYSSCAIAPNTVDIKKC